MILIPRRAFNVVVYASLPGLLKILYSNVSFAFSIL